MKLLLYSHFFAPSVGGVETIVLSLARGLAALRDSNGAPPFEITLVTQTPAGNYADSAHPFGVIRKPNFMQLWQLVRKSDVVHVAGPALAPLVLAWLSRKPFVVEHHGFQTICPNGQLVIEPTGKPCPGHFRAGHHMECLRCNLAEGWLSSQKLWLLTFVRRFLCTRAVANIAPTQWLGGLLGLPHVVTIPHGLDLPPLKLSPSVVPGPPVISFLGRLVTAKGVRVLLEAAIILRGQHRPFELLIVGDGPERDALEQFTLDSQLQARVKFTGRLDETQLNIALAKTSIIVVPSVGGEVFGLVLAEAMMRGIPAVASDLGAFAEVLGDSGLSFTTGDPRDLAMALSRLLDNSSLADNLKTSASDRARVLYSLDHMIEAHASLYSNFTSLKSG